MEIVIVAAVAENGVIGRGGDMPWRLRTDLRRFRARTIGKPVVMGRKTYQSLGRPLPGRTNIVVSRDPTFAATGVVATSNLERALEAAHADALRRAVNEIVIAGGSHIYEAMMPHADRLDITHVQACPEGDAHFPAIDPAVWRETEREVPTPSSDDSAPFVWVTYRRMAERLAA